MTLVADKDSTRAASGGSRDVNLAITGMTCASCAARIEKKLSKLDGVMASVNLATESARVQFPATVTVDDLISVVEAAGYRAAVPAGPGSCTGGTERGTGESAGHVDDGETAAALRQRLLICLALAVPVVVLAMVPALHFRSWQWLSLVLASPVAVWGAWPFHRTAFINAWHGVATMDTLVSVGVSAAYLWSLYALFLGSAGRAGVHMAACRTNGAGA